MVRFVMKRLLPEWAVVGTSVRILACRTLLRRGIVLTLRIGLCSLGGIIVLFGYLCPSSYRIDIDHFGGRNELFAGIPFLS
jgi:hypothetical protein